MISPVESNKETIFTILWTIFTLCKANYDFINREYGRSIAIGDVIAPGESQYWIDDFYIFTYGNLKVTVRE